MSALKNMSAHKNWFAFFAILASAAFLLAPFAVADEAAEGAAEKPAAEAPAEPEQEDLSIEQSQLADRYARLEQAMLRLAELTAANDPQRAAVLRQAVAEGKNSDVPIQFERLIELLQQERLAAAGTNQTELRADLQKLLDMLIKENNGSKIADEKRRIREIIRDVERLERMERSAKAQNEAGGDPDQLSKNQGEIADEAGKTIDKLNPGGEGKPGEGKPGEGKPGEGKPGEGKPGEGKPGEGKPGEGKPGEGKPGEGKPGEGKPGEGKPGEGKPGEGKPGEGKPGEGKPGEGKPGEGKPGEGKPGEGKPGEGKPGEGKPGEGKPGEGKPGEGKPGEGKPGEGQPGEGQPGEGQPGEGQQGGEEGVKKKLQEAQEKMREAQRQLEEAKRRGAKEAQEEAIRKLGEAKAELEKILRQLREEELERMLALLEARFKRMLQMQIEVYEGTKRLDHIPVADRGRDDEIQAGRLSRREAEIVREADKTLVLLNEDGSSVAFPEALSQVRDDMEQVVVLLAQSDTGELTQGIEEDIIASLEELLEAVKKAIKEQEEQKQKQGKPQEGQEQQKPLIDKIAELKMIRALQMRVNTRTGRYSRYIDGEQANKPEILKALEKLAEHQQRIYRAARDLHTGKNE